jgi:hypothetical protein
LASCFSIDFCFLFFFFFLMASEELALEGAAEGTEETGELEEVATDWFHRTPKFLSCFESESLLEARVEVKGRYKNHVECYLLRGGKKIEPFGIVYGFAFRCSDKAVFVSGANWTLRSKGKNNKKPDEEEEEEDPAKTTPGRSPQIFAIIQQTPDEEPYALGWEINAPRAFQLNDVSNLSNPKPSIPLQNQPPPFSVYPH